MSGLAWHPVGSMLRPHTGEGTPFAACPKGPCRAWSRAEDAAVPSPVSVQSSMDHVSDGARPGAYPVSKTAR
jgi:hypothetical protein